MSTKQSGRNKISLRARNLNSDKLKVTDKLATKDGYTVRSILSNPALGAERLDDSGRGGQHARMVRPVRHMMTDDT